MDVTRDFAEFCVKNILNSARLVTSSGGKWELKESMGGVAAGEAYTSLDACARGLVNALWRQYKEQGRAQRAA